MIEIKDIIKIIRVKKNPNAINWYELAKEVAISVADKIIPERLAEIKEEFKKEFSEIFDALMKEQMKDLTPEKLRGSKGPIGLRGLKGDSITGPQGPAGPKPTEEELKEIIKPLIPRAKDGETPSDSRLLKLINPLLPKKKDLLALIKPLIALFEERLNRKIADAIRRSGRARPATGGGTGNVVPESFSVGSSTTAVTLANRVASNGRAIWLNYQGQTQQYGTHFTVSGRIVTLLFTPQDSTFIDIIYVRT